MPRKKKSAEELVSNFNIDVDALYETYMTNSGAATAKKFGMVGEKQIKRILEAKGFDISNRTFASISIDKLIKEHNIDINQLYDIYLHNGITYTAKCFEISAAQVKSILTSKGYDLDKRLSRDELKHSTRYSVSELIENLILILMLCMILICITEVIILRKNLAYQIKI